MAKGRWREDCVECGREIKRANPRARKCRACLRRNEHERREVRRRARIPTAVATAARERDGKQCVYCGWEPGVGGSVSFVSSKLEYDHLVPALFGGTGKDIRNVVVCCNGCNRAKRGKSPLYFLMELRRKDRKWRVPGYVWDLAIELCRDRLMGGYVQEVGKVR